LKYFFRRKALLAAAYRRNSKKDIVEQGKFEARNLGPDFSDSTPPGLVLAPTHNILISGKSIHSFTIATSAFLDLAQGNSTAIHKNTPERYQLTSSDTATPRYRDYKTFCGECAAAAYRSPSHFEPSRPGSP
jgi:hypothetical protein